MNRLKIRSKVPQAEGVDTRSFKLGYQVGFRESEGATIERLLKEFQPIQNERDALLLEVHSLKNKIEKLRKDINMSSITSSAGEVEGGSHYTILVDNPSLRERLLSKPVLIEHQIGIDLAQHGPDISRMLSIGGLADEQD